MRGCRPWFLHSARPLREITHKNSPQIFPPSLHRRAFGDLPLVAGRECRSKRPWQGREPLPSRARSSAPRSAPGAARPSQVGEEEGQSPPAAAGGAGRLRQEAGRRGLNCRRALGRGRSRAGSQLAREAGAPSEAVGEMKGSGPGWGMLPENCSLLVPPPPGPRSVSLC